MCSLQRREPAEGVTSVDEEVEVLVGVAILTYCISMPSIRRHVHTMLPSEI